MQSRTALQVPFIILMHLSRYTLPGSDGRRGGCQVSSWTGSLVMQNQILLFPCSVRSLGARGEGVFELGQLPVSQERLQRQICASAQPNCITTQPDLGLSIHPSS